jgi:hypothetical protein
MPTLALHYFGLLSITILQEDPSSDFSELGKELLGGFMLAVVIAVAYTFIKLRLRDKKPPTQFLSISSDDHPTRAPHVGIPARGPEESANIAHE